MSAVTSSAPKYKSCSISRCGKEIYNHDYIEFLVQSGVSIDALVIDLFLDTHSCCYNSIQLPKPEKDYVNRLKKLNSIILTNPPSFYVGSSRRRATYTQKAIGITNHFIGAEIYAYLVERGENPYDILEHLQIADADVKKIIEKTDIPIYDPKDYCRTCEQYIPYREYAGHVYRNERSEGTGHPSLYLHQADLLTKECCRQYVLESYGDDEVKNLYNKGQFNKGIILEQYGDVCISCGESHGSEIFDDSLWLMHRGIPPPVVLNYFGVFELCCRGSLISPFVDVKESSKAKLRKLSYEYSIPPEPVAEFDYEANELPDL